MMAAIVATTVGVVGVALQASPGMAPLPAEPPIGGAIWTVVVPALLLLVGGVFVAETASVIIQTSAFRWRKRRVCRQRNR